jgi:ribosomal protein S28E/S33
MPMTPDQLRQALGDLNGLRHVRIRFIDNTETCTIERALLVPVEADHIVKLTDGSHEYLVDAERVAWVEIG